jgi:hypothetical protein
MKVLEKISIKKIEILKEIEFSFFQKFVFQKFDFQKFLKFQKKINFDRIRICDSSS